MWYGVPQPQSDYDVCRDGVIQNNCEHLEFFNVHGTHGRLTFFFYSAHIGMRPRRQGSNHRPRDQQCNIAATGPQCWLQAVWVAVKQHTPVIHFCCSCRFVNHTAFMQRKVENTFGAVSKPTVLP